MFGRSGRISSALAALAVLGSGFGGAIELQSTWNPPRPRYRAGPGMTYATHRSSRNTAAQQKRASRKARNVKRHKAHAKG